MSRPGPPQVPQPSQPPQQPSQVSRPPPPPGYPQQPPFQGYYPPYGQRFGPPGYPPGPGFPPYGAPPGWYPPPGHGFPQGPGQFPPSQGPIGPPGQQQQQRPGGPGTPGPANTPKPTSELPVTEKVSSKPASKSATPVPAAAQNGAILPVETKPSVSEAIQATTAPAAAPNVATTKAGPGPAPASSSATATPQTPSKAPPSGPKNDRFVPAIPISNPTTKPATTAAATQSVASVAAGATTQATASQGTAQAAITEATRAATAAVAAAMAKLPQPNAQKKAQQNDAAVETVTKKLNDLKTYDGNRGHRGQGQRGGRGRHHAPAKKIEVPDIDFDFESANAKFNKQDLVKEAIASGSPMRESEEKKDVNGAGTEGAKETVPVATAPGPAYNKASSFFDNISSEIRDREEGVRPRERRGEEEKKNIETFGQGSVDGYRGSYRNRGRGRNYGGSRGRGGYNRGYNNNRGRGALRGGRNASQATGVPAQT